MTRAKTHPSSPLHPLISALNDGAREIAHERPSDGLAAIACALTGITEAQATQQEEQDELEVAPWLEGRQQDLSKTPNAFLFPFLMDPTTSCFLGAVCGVACYNMAVAYHAEAAKAASPQERLALLKCAKNLYLRADDLIAENPHILDPQGSFVYVYLALCHNLIAIHRELGEESEERYGYLVNTFKFSVAEDYDSPMYRYFAAATNRRPRVFF